MDLFDLYYTYNNASKPIFVGVLPVRLDGGYGTFTLVKQLILTKMELLTMTHTSIGRTRIKVLLFIQSPRIICIEKTIPPVNKNAGVLHGDHRS